MVEPIQFKSQAEKFVETAEGMLNELKASLAAQNSAFMLNPVYLAHYFAIDKQSRDNSFSHQRHMKDILDETKAVIYASSSAALFKSAINIYKQEQDAIRRMNAEEVRTRRLKFDEVPEGEYVNYDPKSMFPLPTKINAELAFKWLKIDAAKNLMTEKVKFKYQGEDVSIPRLRNIMFDEIGIDFPELILEQAVNGYCERFSFHPIRDWLDTLQYRESVGIIDDWMTHVLGAERTELNRQIGTKMLVAMVARIYEPGTKFDQMIVFESNQGLGKSTAIEILCGTTYFNSGSIMSMDSKKQMEALKGRWIYESAELAGHSKADTDTVKAFLSQTVDIGRWAYAHSVADHPRTCIFVGTTNKSEYLIDDTGNRRYWPVKCNVVPTKAFYEGKLRPNEANLQWLKDNREQLFVEARRLYEEGYSLTLDRDLWGDVEKIQKTKFVEVPGIEYVSQVFGLSSSEGLNIEEDKELHILDLRIFTRDLHTYVFEFAFSRTTSAGRHIKSAMTSYNHVEFARWEYKACITINGLRNSGYVMSVRGKDRVNEMKGIIEAHVRARARNNMSNSPM